MGVFFENQFTPVVGYPLHLTRVPQVVPDPIPPILTSYLHERLPIDEAEFFGIRWSVGHHEAARRHPLEELLKGIAELATPKDEDPAPSQDLGVPVAHHIPVFQGVKSPLKSFTGWRFPPEQSEPLAITECREAPPELVPQGIELRTVSTKESDIPSLLGPRMEELTIDAPWNPVRVRQPIKEDVGVAASA